ncbi:hypothetical protein D3874_09085 [Oleomonas cavernae]|uniref:Uncharacterized protein n=1 Tax=Oleomonas cavernae TaxID=2320859 RepID=A0A418WAY8_9PROT|nr:hypothetical protein D3874_09085 [Oleomonas cavernae]
MGWDGQAEPGNHRTSFRRRPESILGQRATSQWIPAFAGMTGKESPPPRQRGPDQITTRPEAAAPCVPA